MHSQSIKKVAQMAESVDALVSNTSGFTSIPVRPRVWVQKPKSSVSQALTEFFIYNRKQTTFSLPFYTTYVSLSYLCLKYYFYCQQS